MGCCQSDLKGEKQEDIDNQAPQPIKQVKTNFSTVDYDAAASGRRDTIVAPEEVRQKSNPLPSLSEKETSSLHPQSLDSTAVSSTKPQVTGDDRISFDNRIEDQPSLGIESRHIEDTQTRLPYEDVTASPTTPTAAHTIGEQLPGTKTYPSGLACCQQRQTHKHNRTEHIIMGLFNKSKKLPEDPSNPILSSESGGVTTEDRPRKKSLYQKYQDLKRGPSTSQLSEEDLKKYTGMDRTEFDKWAATTPGVAGGQAAGSLTAGGNSGLGGTAAGEGLGGWGREAGKQPTIR
ncbi:hypothetical protein LTR64_003141 [Lithohypha guttulata]|uniref:uncharacterized protein n=1 Tax=Lithohypha guttulata TaxID=1690604 RepID=UPI002DDFA2CB|nr:hypothetical protein LTR51_000636 [Lithohypha guttulata]